MKRLVFSTMLLGVMALAMGCPAEPETTPGVDVGGGYTTPEVPAGEVVGEEPAEAQEGSGAKEAAEVPEGSGAKEAVGGEKAAEAAKPEPAAEAPVTPPAVIAPPPAEKAPEPEAPKPEAPAAETPQTK